MIDKEGRVLYVGKAKNLKKRVHSYFQDYKEKTIRTKKMVEQVNDIQYITVDNELEAILLETNLIKELRPKYNILMKDDKNFVYIKVDSSDDFPTISIVRKVERDGAKYFGPKTSKWKVEKTFDLLHKLFPFRNCKLKIDWDSTNNGEDQYNVIISNKTIKYPCLEYHIKRCAAPCLGIVKPEEYKKMIDQIINFLSGKHEEILNKLKEEMILAAKDRKFEIAAKLRDQVLAIEDVMEKQKISSPNDVDQDLISYVIKNNSIFFNLFMVRSGKLINQENFIFETKETLPLDKGGWGDLSDSPSEIYESFIKQYYSEAADIPKEILIAGSMEEQDFIEHWLSNLKGSKVKITIPQKGDKNKLLELSLKNAENYAKDHISKFESEKKRTIDAAMNLAKILQENGLQTSNDLKRIECYDISHLSGTYTVASMVVFEKGKPKNDHYRHFNIRTLENGQIDDFKSMEEVLTRRLKYLKNSPTDKGDLGGFALPSSYKISKATEKDLPKINEFMKSEGWGEKKHNDEFVILKNNKKEIKGCVRIKYKGEKKLAHICNVFINEDLRGSKLGLALVKAMMEKCTNDQIYIICRASLVPYYTNLGFVIDKNIPEEFHQSIELNKKIYINEEVFLMKYDDRKQIGTFKIKKEKNKEQSYILERETIKSKKQVGSACLEKFDQNHYLVKINLLPDYENKQNLIGMLLDRVIEDSPIPTVYINFQSSASNYKEFLINYGFDELQKTPECFKDLLTTNNSPLTTLIYDRNKNAKSKDESFSSTPDLIVIDGGKGQLSSAQIAMFSLNLNIPMIGLAKQDEEIILPFCHSREDGNPVNMDFTAGKLDSENHTSILLPKSSPTLHLLQRIRDEAHRFAITFNREKRSKNLIN